MRFIYQYLVLIIFLFTVSSCEGEGVAAAIVSKPSLDEKTVVDQRYEPQGLSWTQKILHLRRRVLTRQGSSPEPTSVGDKRITSSWQVYTGSIQDFIEGQGGVEGLKQYGLAARASYPWGLINKKLYDFQVKYRLVDQEGLLLKENISKQASEAWEVLKKEIKAYLVRPMDFSPSVVKKFYSQCGLTPINLSKLPLTEEMKKSELYKGLNLSNVYLFKDDSGSNFTILNIHDVGVRWLTMAKVEFEAGKGKEEGTLIVSTTPPAVDFGNYLKQTQDQQKCPIKFEKGK